MVRAPVGQAFARIPILSIAFGVFIIVIFLRYMYFASYISSTNAKYMIPPEKQLTPTTNADIITQLSFPQDGDFLTEVRLRLTTEIHNEYAKTKSSSIFSSPAPPMLLDTSRVNSGLKLRLSAESNQSINSLNERKTSGIYLLLNNLA